MMEPYVLLSAFAEKQNIVPVKITVFEYKINFAPKIHLAIAVKAIEKARVIAELTNKSLHDSAVASPSKVKLSQFLQLVKDKAFADYIPPQFESEGKVEDVQGLELGHGRTDSEGNALTEQQQRYFQDSKVRNVSGNLQMFTMELTLILLYYTPFSPHDGTLDAFSIPVNNYWLYLYLFGLSIFFAFSPK